MLELLDQNKDWCRPMKLSTLALILLLATSTRVIAQGVSVGPQGVKLMGYGDIDVEKTMKRWEETTTQRIDTLIDLQIEAKLKDLLLSQVTVSFPTNADEATALVQPTLADRTLIDPVLTERQRNALDDYTNLKNWVGVGWKAR